MKSIAYGLAVMRLAESISNRDLGHLVDTHDMFVNMPIEVKFKLENAKAKILVAWHSDDTIKVHTTMSVGSVPVSKESVYDIDIIDALKCSRRAEAEVVLGMLYDLDELHHTLDTFVTD